MLVKIRDLRGDRIRADDGDVGSVDEVYFDDEAWDVRYLAVDARRWMPGCKYFISPVAIGRGRRFAACGGVRVGLTREQISRCPTAPQAKLRSSTEVLGCGIQARDGVIGRVADLLVDDEIWEITDVLVDSRDWLRGSMLLISPEVVERIDWPKKTMHLSLAREDILQAPAVRL